MKTKQSFGFVHSSFLPFDLIFLLFIHGLCFRFLDPIGNKPPPVGELNGLSWFCQLWCQCVAITEWYCNSFLQCITYNLYVFFFLHYFSFVFLLTLPNKKQTNKHDLCVCIFVLLQIKSMAYSSTARWRSGNDRAYQSWGPEFDTH